MMENRNNISTRRQEEIFINIFFGMIIILILLFLNIMEIEFIIERIIKLFKFLIGIVLLIILPRRILRKSKRFRCLVLYIRKKYPKIFYYYYHKFSLLIWIDGIFVITKFYLERMLKYFLVGTKVKMLTPYKENWEKWEIISKIIIEIYKVIQYIIYYILKKYYEIILFFDTVSIKEIKSIKTVIIILVIIGYILLGVYFFIICILCWILGVYIYTGLHIYFNYKRKKEKNYDIERLTYILNFFGCRNSNIYILDQIYGLQEKIKILIYPIKFRNKFYYDAVKRKYGAKEATRCYLNVGGLIAVSKDDCILILNKEKAKEKGIEIKYMSKYKFLTDIYLKIKWYYELEDLNIIGINLIDKGFDITMSYLKEIPNLFYMYMEFISAILFCFIIEEDKINEINEKECIEDFNKFWNQETKEGVYYLKYWKEFFEFQDLYKFVEKVKKKKEEMGYEGFKKSLEEIDYFIINYNIYELYKRDILTLDELGLLVYELNLLFLDKLGIEYNKEEYKKFCTFRFKEDYDIYKEKIKKKLEKYNIKL